MKVADLGMGWGTAAAYMHEHGKLDVTGVSLSEQQVKWAKENLAKPGLKFVWSDYRDHCEDPAIAGTYDRVYSIGMFEHLGPKNYESFFKCVKALLKPDGLAVIHTIGEPDYLPISDPFLEKYIFPGAVIPTISGMSAAFENHFILEDFQNFGHDYSKTLAAWHVNSLEFFKQKPEAYTPEFQRMWHYYLKMCEALFELRINQLWHFVLSPRRLAKAGYLAESEGKEREPPLKYDMDKDDLPSPTAHGAEECTLGATQPDPEPAPPAIHFDWGEDDEDDDESFRADDESLDDDTESENSWMEPSLHDSDSDEGGDVDDSGTSFTGCPSDEDMPQHSGIDGDSDSPWQGDEKTDQSALQSYVEEVDGTKVGDVAEVVAVDETAARRGDSKISEPIGFKPKARTIGSRVRNPHPEESGARKETVERVKKIRLKKASAKTRMKKSAAMTGQKKRTRHYRQKAGTQDDEHTSRWLRAAAESAKKANLKASGHGARRKAESDLGAMLKKAVLECFCATSAPLQEHEATVADVLQRAEKKEANHEQTPPPGVGYMAMGAAGQRQPGEPAARAAAVSSGALGGAAARFIVDASVGDQACHRTGGTHFGIEFDLKFKLEHARRGRATFTPRESSQARAAAAFLMGRSGCAPPVNPELALIPGSSGAVNLGGAAPRRVCVDFVTGAPGEAPLLLWVGDVVQCAHGASKSAFARLSEADLALARNIGSAQLSTGAKSSTIVTSDSVSDAKSDADADDPDLGPDPGACLPWSGLWRSRSPALLARGAAVLALRKGGEDAEEALEVVAELRATGARPLRPLPLLLFPQGLARCRGGERPPVRRFSTVVTDCSTHRTYVAVHVCFVQDGLEEEAFEPLVTCLWSDLPEVAAPPFLALLSALHAAGVGEGSAQSAAWSPARAGSAAPGAWAERFAQLCGWLVHEA
ncbi:unnamed protein product, partial [Prorocentrum cordatum]